MSDKRQDPVSRAIDYHERVHRETPEKCPLPECGHWCDDRPTLAEHLRRKHGWA